MIAKVWFGRIWVMAGTDVQLDGERPKLVDSCYLLQHVPPYYRGRGKLIRIGRRSVRVGTCTAGYVVHNEFSDNYDIEQEFAAAGVGHMDITEEMRSLWQQTSEPGDSSPRDNSEQLRQPDSGPESAPPA